MRLRRMLHVATAGKAVTETERCVHSLSPVSASASPRRRLRRSIQSSIFVVSSGVVPPPTNSNLQSSCSHRPGCNANACCSGSGWMLMPHRLGFTRCCYLTRERNLCVCVAAAAEVAVAARLLMMELVLPSPTIYCLPQKQLSSAAFPADVEMVLNKTLLAI